MSVDEIRNQLGSEVRAAANDIELFDSLPSTNSYLMDAEPPPVGGWRAVIAREQTAGRGRADHSWHSPQDGGLWLSFAYTFAEDAPIAGTMTLALGVAVAEAIKGAGVERVCIKWPNDLIVDDRKLGGLLVELRGRTAVCGIGINTKPIDERVLTAPPPVPPIDLGTLLGDVPSVHSLAGAIIDGSVSALSRYGKVGFAPFVAIWQQCDWLAGREVIVPDLQPVVRGRAAGIDDDGALIIKNDNVSFRVVAGTIRLADKVA